MHCTPKPVLGKSRVLGVGGAEANEGVIPETVTSFKGKAELRLGETARLAASCTDISGSPSPAATSSHPTASRPGEACAPSVK